MPSPSSSSPKKKKTLRSSLHKNLVEKKSAENNPQDPQASQESSQEVDSSAGMTPSELLEGLSKVVEKLKGILDHPSEKPVTEEIHLQMEKIHELSSFLTAVFANMGRIAIEEGSIPQPPTEEQRDLARKAEALGWSVRALQEKASILLDRDVKSPKNKKRRMQLERREGEGKWKKL